MSPRTWIHSGRLPKMASCQLRTKGRPALLDGRHRLSLCGARTARKNILIRDDKSGLRIAISSIPMARGPGVPARASCAFMYCASSALTVWPIKRQFLRNIRDRRLSATAADKIRKALGVERVVCQKVEPFPFHLAAATAIDAPHLQLKQYSHVPAGQVTHLPDFAIVPSHLDAATAST